MALEASKKILLLILKASVSAVSLYLVFRKADMKQISAILVSIGPFPFLLCVLLYILSQMTSTFRWKLLLPERFTYRRLFSLYMIGAFFSSFLPGVIGGDAVRAYYLNKDARKISLTLASIFMDRYVGYAGLMTIGIIFFPFAVPFFHGSPYAWTLPAIVAAFVAGSIFFFGLQIGRRFRVVAEFYQYFTMIRQRKGTVFRAFLLSLFVQMLNFLMVNIFAVAMEAEISALVLFVFLPIVITLTTLPISISGIGVREGSFVLLLGLVGVRPEVATSISLAWFFSTFAGGLLGLVFYLRQPGDAGAA